MSNQTNKLARAITKDINKAVKKANRKIKPIKLPTQLNNHSDALSFTNNYHDNSISITTSGDILNSQIGGKNNQLMNEFNEQSAYNLMENIREYSKILNENERNSLSEILNEVAKSSSLNQNKYKNFLDKHPILSLAFSTLLTWGIENGMESFTQLINDIF